MDIDSSKLTGNGGGAANYIRFLLGKKGPANEHRKSDTGVHSDTNAAADASGAAAGPTEREDTGAGEDSRIVLGEITAYRCWDTSDGTYKSLNGHLWFPNEPMHADGVSLAGSAGFYAFRTLEEAKKNAKSHGSRLAVGSVKLWGTIVEHDDGYRAEYAVIDKIISGAVPEYSDDLKKAIEAKKALGPEFEKRHQRDLDRYKFRCERYGDFLSVFIERNGLKMASALSLIGVGAITPQPGTPVASGALRFSHYKDNGKITLYECDTVSVFGQMLHVPTPSAQTAGQIYYGGAFGGPQPITVPDCAIPARDDMVHLTGTGVIIYAPYSKGTEVFDQILKAMREAE